MKVFTSLLLLVCLSVLVRAQSTTFVPADFQKKVDDAKMLFVKPEGATNVQVVQNTAAKYDYAIKLKDRNVEVRYLIWPLTKAFFEAYENRNKTPGDTVLNPNKMHISIPAILYSKISGRKLASNQIRLQNFSKQAVGADFKAEEGNMFMGRVDSAYSDKYKYGFFLMIHKDYAGDAYIQYLFENEDEMFKLMSDINHDHSISVALKFKE